MSGADLETAFAGKRVLVTGHTGFKGAWLCLWLHRLGARVTGYALPPPTEPSLFERARVAELVDHRLGDVRDAAALGAVVAEVDPDYVFHLAAQPLVLDSYTLAAETFAVNLGGSINVMEALRGLRGPVGVVMVTTDKVYRNREWAFGYREDDPLGGHDPYSASKAAMEIAVGSWRDSFFAAQGRVRMASARAGNAIGGGDWASSRLVPDLVRALLRGEEPAIRRPGSQRPWQHVLEPLAGYLRLAALLGGNDGADYAQSWNFGPMPSDVRDVAELTAAVCREWGGASWRSREGAGPHEAGILRLAIDKAVSGLGWRPTWDFDHSVERTVAWYRAVERDGSDARAACLTDLDAFARAGG
jgi:CDP-glucose 4,6-dehydratase